MKVVWNRVLFNILFSVALIAAIDSGPNFAASRSFLTSSDDEAINPGNNVAAGPAFVLELDVEEDSNTDQSRNLDEDENDGVSNSAQWPDIRDLDHFERRSLMARGAQPRPGDQRSPKHSYRTRSSKKTTSQETTVEKSAAEAAQHQARPATPVRGPPGSHAMHEAISAQAPPDRPTKRERPQNFPPNMASTMKYKPGQNMGRSDGTALNGPAGKRLKFGADTATESRLASGSQAVPFAEPAVPRPGAQAQPQQQMQSASLSPQRMSNQNQQQPHRSQHLSPLASLLQEPGQMRYPKRLRGQLPITPLGAVQIPPQSRSHSWPLNVVTEPSLPMNLSPQAAARQSAPTNLFRPEAYRPQRLAGAIRSGPSLNPAQAQAQAQFPSQLSQTPRGNGPQPHASPGMAMSHRTPPARSSSGAFTVPDTRARQWPQPQPPQASPPLHPAIAAQQAQAQDGHGDQLRAQTPTNVRIEFANPATVPAALQAEREYRQLRDRLAQSDASNAERQRRNVEAWIRKMQA